MMTTLDDFRFKWNGKGIDFDGVYGDQCMDLMHQYVVEVLGLSDGRILAAPAAKDVYLNFANVFGNQYFDKIPNTPTGVPQKGDIIFFGTEVGQYGHVSIFLSGDVNQLVTFDQNWSGHQYCETITHGYGGVNGVMGWLRYKPQVDPCATQNVQIAQLQTQLKTANDTITSLSSKIAKAKQDLQ